MAGMLNTSSVLMCPHGGTVTATPGHASVQVGGELVLRSSDTFTIAGCPFAIGTSPHPCVSVQWSKTAEQSQVMDDFTLTEDSQGLCIAGDQARQGAVLILFTQPQVDSL
jgi:hypothetical protein